MQHIKDFELAGDIVDLLQYDEDTAGGLMSTEMVVVNANWSMPECLKEMRRQAEDLDDIYYIYVVDDEERLCGTFPLKKMVTSPSVVKVKHVMTKEVVSADVDTPIDEVAMLIEKIEGLDCVSMGPQMHDIHTSRERLEIASTERTWKYLLEVLKNL